MVETANYVHDLGGVLRVQVPGRLVGKQDRGIVHEGARDSDALLLSAGKLVRIVLLAAMQSHHFEQFRGAPLALACPGGVEQWQFDVLVRESRLKLWKTKPMRRLRIAASSSSLSEATSTPSSV